MEQFGVIAVDHLVFERHLDAPPERVWRALTDPDELAGWLAPAEIDLRVGGHVVLKFEEREHRGTITELREPEVLAYTWDEARTNSLVRFKLEPEAGGTRLTLRHTFELEADLSGYGGGWHQHLELLAGHVTGAPVDWDRDRFRELKAEYAARASDTAGSRQES
jgi:uncharacterized protein YndB with AHSA1/START domain